MFISVIGGLVGSIVGVVTGMIPGLHTNTIALLVLSLFMFGVEISQDFALPFMVCMILVHSFVDYIPSIFFNAPSSDTVLSVLPGHRLLNRGEGYLALQNTVIGGLISAILFLPLIPLFIVVANLFDSKLLVAPFLLIISTWLILSELELRNIIWATLVFLLSGIVGIVSLNSLFVGDALFPLLTGLFGLSVMLISLRNEINLPPQEIFDEIELFNLSNVFAGLFAIISGSFMILIPSLGPTQAATISRGALKGSKNFLKVMGGINTLDTILSIIMLYLIGSARSGVMVVMQQTYSFTQHSYLLMGFSAALGLSLGAAITLVLAKKVLFLIKKIKYKHITIGMLAFLVGLVGWFTGIRGLFLMSIATTIGILAQLVGVRKVHLMGVLAMPTLLNYS